MLIRTNRYDLKAELNHAINPHMTTHALVLEHAAWELTATNRSTVTEVFVRSVSSDKSAHPVSLHNSGEAFPLRDTDYVDLLAWFKHSGDSDF